jgi:hypothetical protein
MSHQAFQVQLFGDVSRGITLAEIEFSDRPLVASVFEGPDGWHIEITSPATASFPLDTFLMAVAEARERLSGCVNRRGASPPEGLSPAGLSHWLLDCGNVD